MRIPIIDIGNSKGIRIPQALLKQLEFGQEVELEIRDGSLSLAKPRNPLPVPHFDGLENLEDSQIQSILMKTTGTDLVTALVGASPEVKEAVYRNLSRRVHDYVAPTVERLEKGDAKDLLIEQARNRISEIAVGVLRD